MLPFHQRLAEVGLAAIARYGFVLAGGYAIAANGIGQRPSDDVDLFTNNPDPGRFGEAADKLRSALREDGLEVVDQRTRPTFVQLQVTDSAAGLSSEIQLGLDYRGYPPAQLAVGPVLDVRDAVGGKMSALWSRGEARDFIDIDAVIESGRFSGEQVLAIADRVETVPLDRAMLAARFREAGRHPVQLFTRYGVEPARRDQIVARFADWASQVDPKLAGEAPYETVTRPPKVGPGRDLPDPGLGQDKGIRP